MTKNILIKGADEQLYNEIQKLASSYVKYFDAKQLNFTNKLSIEKYCEHNNISMIINCTAITGFDTEEMKAANKNHPKLSYIACSINHLDMAIT